MNLEAPGGLSWSVQHSRVHRDVLVTVWVQLGKPPSPGKLPTVSCACCHGPGLLGPSVLQGAIFPGDALWHLSWHSSTETIFVSTLQEGLRHTFSLQEGKRHLWWTEPSVSHSDARAVWAVLVTWHHFSPRQESSQRASSRHPHTGLYDWHEVKGYLEPPPECWGTFHKGHFAGALLTVPGFSFVFTICFLLGRLLWIPTQSALKLTI